MQLFAPVVLIVSVLVLSVAPETQARGCGSLRASGNWGEVTVTVRTVRGEVGCREARKVARLLFSGQGCYENNGAGYNSYWRVGKWKGDARAGSWVMRHSARGAEIAGRVRVRADNDKEAREC